MYGTTTYRILSAALFKNHERATQATLLLYDMRVLWFTEGFMLSVGNFISYQVIHHSECVWRSDW